MSDDIPHFVMCTACYADYAEATAFTNKLSLKNMGNGWTCDLAVRYIRRLWSHSLNNIDWPSFINSTKHRMQLSCKGIGQKAGANEYYTTTSRIEGLAICEACYLDYIRLSPFKTGFMRVNCGHGNWTCNFQELSLRVPWEIGVEWKRDFNLFVDSARSFATSPCDPKGMPTAGRTWHTLKSGNYNFGVCPTHYHALVLPYFYPAIADQTWTTRDMSHWGEKFTCDFNPASHERAKKCVLKHSEAVDNSDISLFTSYVAKISHLPTCPDCKGTKNRNWYIPTGSPLVQICEACYTEIISNTPFASNFTQTGVVATEGRCNLYSPRMQGLFFSALQSDDFSVFLTPAQERAEIFCELWPRYVMLESQEGQRRISQIYNTKMAMMSASSDVAMGINYGGSSVAYHTVGGGTYNSMFGVEGERYRAQADSAMFQVGGRMGLAKVKALLMQYE
jgi:hypothetical protein